MKALLITGMIIAGSLIASTGYSQVFVNARFGFRPRVGIGIVAPAPRVVYAAPAPAPVVYDEACAPAGPVFADAPYVAADFVSYPAWNGHFRDRVYYEHYRPFVAARYYHRGYGNRGFEHRRW